MSKTAINVSPLRRGTPPNEESLTRRFLGKLSDFKDKREQAFNQRMLKAYVKGHQYFAMGRYDNGQPIMHRVKQEFFYQSNKNQ